ncbi:GM16481 [Drosophila sechellia]|uniref:GM16481 n=1 Tax=Drosophila sechellia TaxID=7238 RepID=B4HY77_DROSE|nr:GM16481 [Drosophila sechellia]
MKYLCKRSTKSYLILQQFSIISLDLILLATSVESGFWEDFYRILSSENAKKNLIYSPISAEIIMSMVYMAAGGKTFEELKNAWKFSENKTLVANNYRSLLNDLKRREKAIILHLAIRIYVNKKYCLVPEFNEVARKAFKAKAKSIRLDDPVSASAIVNSWILNRTRGIIRNIVSPKDLDPDTSAFLVNAIYFKGQWLYKFQADQTHVADFHVSAKEIIPVKMMTLSASLLSADIDDIDAKVIELPYWNSTLSMRIILPNSVDGLRKLEEKVGFIDYHLEKKSVNVMLPKFKIECSAQLKGIFENLGIRDVFKPSADLNGLVVESGAKIEKIVQKAFLKIDEKGGEASAATGVLTRRKKSIDNLRLPPMEFIVDHPFFYVIHDNKVIYFQGHIVQPQW